MTQSVAAVILAAGMSRRMGTPKMLLPWGQTTVLGQVISIFMQAGLQEIVIVTGGARQAVESELALLSHRFPVHIVYNPDCESGEMLSSIQCGLAGLSSQVPAALIGLGDQPQLSLAAIQAVLGTQTNLIVVPSYNMRRGHPWLVGRQFWPELMELKPPQTTRDFLNDHAGIIQYVSTDLTVLKDLDTPEEYQREKP